MAGAPLASLPWLWVENYVYALLGAWWTSDDCDSNVDGRDDAALSDRAAAVAAPCGVWMPDLFAGHKLRALHAAAASLSPAAVVWEATKAPGRVAADACVARRSLAHRWTRPRLTCAPPDAADCGRFCCRRSGATSTTCRSLSGR